MMSSRIQAEQLRVKHVRYPRERMPVCPIAARESPLDSLYRDPVFHVGVVYQVFRIIEADKGVPEYRPKGGERSDGEQNAHRRG